LWLVTLIEFPAIVGGFQENNLRSDNRMPLESFVVLDGCPLRTVRSSRALKHLQILNQEYLQNVTIADVILYTGRV
jgi:hypothetical protein